jgi:pyruvate dehydrogenase E1 component alpha subunit
MPSMVVNGMDVQEVRESFRTVLDAMRKRPYPFLIEARTYRYRGHSMSDPATYRTKEGTR